MKKIFILAAMLATFITAFGKHVTQVDAKTVGYNFLKQKIKGHPISSVNDLLLAYTAYSGNETFFYVFNANGNFVFVAADDQVTPVFGYSNERDFVSSNMPNNVSDWLKGYSNQIQFVIEKNIPATNEITKKWDDLLQGHYSHGALAKTTTVEPLLQTTWDQEPNYNALCPFDNNYGSRSVTGCVATATAQVMKFWNFPSQGQGFHSYSTEGYGTLSADFGSTTYNWANMPNSVSGSNNDVATLMFHVGVALEMNYHASAGGGSSATTLSSGSATTPCAENALKTYFGYSLSLHGEHKDDYSEATWINMIKSELDAGRPLIYRGSGSGGGHCFVADGYDNNDFIHFNWGWSGQSNDYYQIDALNPGSLGAGGGTGGFNSGEGAIFGIQPIVPATGGDAELGLYDYVNVSAPTIYYGQAFSVTTNVYNASATANFSGDYCAAAFDAEGNFVDYVATLTGQSLQAGYAYTSDLTFSNAGDIALLPGTYTIGIYSRSAGGNWTAVENAGSYTNYNTITIINPGDIEMYQAMAITPGLTLTQGQGVIVNLNVVNTTTTNFSGSYDLSLYNTDGTFAASIENLSGQTLPANSYYISGLNFSTSSLTAAPGTYLLALTYNAGSDYYLVGSTNYPNPIYVTVVAAPLSPDQYEINNTVSTAYNLPLTFSGNTSSQTTIGSNIHVGTDQDFYKIGLPNGYTYDITARLQDAFSNNDGQSYTLDAMFSYSTDGTNWSSVYDDVMPGNIQMNGGTLYFHVTPYSTGSIGTYLLDISSIARTPLDISNVTLADAVKVYPNPANIFVTIDMQGSNAKAQTADLMDVQGRKVLTGIIDNKQVATLDLNTLADGLYILQVQTDKGLITKKITVKK